MSEKFFEERLDQSEAKARIVTKYFSAWAKIMMPTVEKRQGRIAYIDLYAGPGRYKDGAASTPLLIIEQILNHEKLSRAVVTYFNDNDANKTDTLSTEIKNLPNISKLKFKPIITTQEIDEQAEKFFAESKLIPTFSFIDPFGYKGLSLNIIKGVIKDWGCDCVFFFNYNRINAGISNDFVRNHMDALFDKDRVETLREKIEGLSPSLREAAILEALSNKIRSLGGEYILPFTFKNKHGTRTSHKLIFVTKHFKGYEIMKDIMAGESSTEDEGVPSFCYSPADASMPLLFSLTRPIAALKNDLLAHFSGKTLTFDEIYKSHSVNTPYIRRNYREILIKLEESGKIRVFSTTGKRRKGTYPAHVKIEFPEVQDNGK